ncbi:MAG: RNA catabolic process, partial [Paramarteilia canceri]
MTALPDADDNSLFVTGFSTETKYNDVSQHFADHKKEIKRLFFKNEGGKAYAFLNFSQNTNTKEIIEIYKDKKLKGSALLFKAPHVKGSQETNPYKLNGNSANSTSQPVKKSVIFTYLDTCSFDFYAVFANKLEEFQSITERINQLGSDFIQSCNGSSNCVKKLPKTGQIYGALFSQDNNWYRAEIIKSQISQEVISSSLVKFIDFGNIDSVSHSEIFSLPVDFAMIPPLCSAFCFEGISVNDDSYIKSDCTKYLNQIFESDELMVTYRNIINNDSKNQSIKCKVYVEGKCINEVLVERGYFSTCQVDHEEPIINGKINGNKLSGQKNSGFFNENNNVDNLNWQDDSNGNKSVYTSYEKSPFTKMQPTHSEPMPRQNDIQIKMNNMKIDKPNFSDSVKTVFDEISSLLKTYSHLKSSQNQVELLANIEEISTFLSSISNFVSFDVNQFDENEMILQQLRNDLKFFVDKIHLSALDFEAISQRNLKLSEYYKNLKSMKESFDIVKLNGTFKYLEDSISTLSKINIKVQNKPAKLLNDFEIKKEMSSVREILKDSTNFVLSDETEENFTKLKTLFFNLSECNTVNTDYSCINAFKDSLSKDKALKNDSDAEKISRKMNLIVASTKQILNNRLNLVSDYKNKLKTINDQVFELENIFDSDGNINLPNSNDLQEISTENREIIRNELNPLIMQKNQCLLDSNENDSSDSDSDLSQSLFKVRAKLMKGFDMELKHVDNLMNLARNFFPELCNNMLVKEALQNDGLVKRRNFLHFNTETIEEGKKWVVVSDDNSKLMIRHIISDNFSTCSQTFVKSVASFNAVPSSNIVKTDYMFFDKINFSIYQVLPYYKISLENFINANFEQTFFPNSNCSNFEAFLKTIIHDLISAISELHKNGLVHGQIMPSKILVDVENKKWMLLNYDFTQSIEKRILSTRNAYSDAFGYNFPLEKGSNDYTFDVRCIAYVLSASIPDCPLSITDLSSLTSDEN